MTFSRASRKVIAIGRNYVEHVKELHNAVPATPFFFLKPPSSIIPPKSTLRIPQGVHAHHEVELALIIGHRATDIPNDMDAAMSVIAGYAVAIDVTARNVQDDAKKKGLPWTIAKGFDTFLPMSSFIPKSSIPDPHNAVLKLTVNHESRQNDSTNLMIFKIPKLLSYISGIMSLEPDDVVLTGTPKGVGRIVHGDVMRASIHVDGDNIKQGNIEIMVQDRVGGYHYVSK
ncbi:putative hydrolase [Neolecta irregularis DAH-3]|uniref:Putative hydrolase n=1 Tax=Neolecta irregularis (strain DAH-3) TaxID=1198029 RepID=A0A1U7LK68_NEOID|nr:putative hydrolase [Neolecta irregularis DAH-3]|eukprot:OLL23047.1 putative hydrolase [Neolecta irregularis DAH-3]